MDKWIQKFFPGPVIIESTYNQVPTSEDTNEDSEQLIPTMHEVSYETTQQDLHNLFANYNLFISR